MWVFCVPTSFLLAEGSNTFVGQNPYHVCTSCIICIKSDHLWAQMMIWIFWLKVTVNGERKSAHSSNICSLAAHIFDVCSILGVNELHSYWGWTSFTIPTPGTHLTHHSSSSMLCQGAPLSLHAPSPTTLQRESISLLLMRHTYAHTHTGCVCVWMCVTGGCDCFCLAVTDWLDKPCLSVVLHLARCAKMECVYSSLAVI